VERLREGVVRAANRLLAAADFRQGVSEALAILRGAARVDRVYVFEYHGEPNTGRRVVSQRFGWSRTTGGVRVDPPELQNIPYVEGGLQRLVGTLSSGRAVHGPVREFPAAERDLLEQFGICSILVVPILNERKLWGMLGFDDCRAERVWSAEEISILETIAVSLGLLIERQRAQERYRALLEEVDAILWEADAATLRFSFVSRRAETMLGYPLEDWLSDERFFERLLHREDRQETLKAYRNAATSAHDQELEYRVRAADGSVLWLHDRVHVECDANGRSVRLRGVMVNTTSRKAAEESSARLAAILEATTDVVGIVDFSGGNHYLNRAGRRILGLGEDEELPRDYPAAFHPEWALKVIGDVAAPLAARDGAWNGETALLTRQGKEIPVSQVVVAHKTRAGVVDSFSTIARDISERKRYEQQITALLEVVADISSSLDLEEIFERAKRRTAALLPCDRVMIFHWDRLRRAVRLVSQYGVPEHLLQDAVALEYVPDADIVDHFMNGRSDVINDPAERPGKVQELLQRFEVGSVVFTPLNLRGRLLGALAAARKAPAEPFDDSHVQLFEGIAKQLALAVEAAELYRAQQEEAFVSRALARFGQEMIASLNNPLLLNRLCQASAEVLGCDCSHTLWRDEKNGACLAAAGYGDAPDQWVRIQRSTLPEPAFAALIDRLEREDMSEMQRGDLAELRDAFGIASGLAIALRYGGQLVGVQTAGYRGHPRPFTEIQRRIARGIARLASMALANTRLVEELKRANRLKADFVATMSHELRTPLNVIIGYNDLLLDGAFGDVSSEQADTLRRMNRSAWELLDLINATLDVSRIESGQVPVEMREIDLATFISQIEEETQEMRAKPGLDFEWTVAPGLPVLCSDPVKLKVVVRNLVSNAVKFTDAGLITIGVNSDDGGIVFEISDTGIGISAETLEVIFEPFRQIDGSLTRRHGGVGLGLYIARRLLDLIGGRISVSSEVGRGTRVRVWVPRGVQA